MLRLVVVTGVCALVASVVLTLATRWMGRRSRLLDGEGAGGHAKTGLRDVPNVGGIAIFWTVALGLVGGLALRGIGATSDRAMAWAGPVLEHTPGIGQRTPMALGLLGCLLALHVMGLVDDRRPLGAWIKMGVMVLAAGVMAVVFDVRLLEMLDGRVGGAWLSIGLTVVWFVAVTNAMNFMDNMDGVAAGTGLVASLCFLVTACLGGQWFVAGVLALLAGALAGFLVFNRPRATIFMGDGGSLVVGFLLAFLTVRTTYVPEGGEAWHAVFMPLCVLAVPLYDLVAVTAIRVSQGRSPLVGDQQHFTHRLRERGLSEWQVLGVIAGLTAVTGISGIVLSQTRGWAAALVGVQVLLTLAVLAFYEHGATRRERDA